MGVTVANTQPIYTRDIINWNARLTNQLGGRKLSIENPAPLGTFNSFGGVIWSIRVVALGKNAASNLRIYGKRSTDTTLPDYRLLFETLLPTIRDTVDNPKNSLIDPSYGNSVYATPPVIELSLPRIYTRNTEESRGLVCTSDYSLYCALGQEVESGWDIFCEGGNY